MGIERDVVGRDDRPAHRRQGLGFARVRIERTHLTPEGLDDHQPSVGAHPHSVRPEERTGRGDTRELPPRRGARLGGIGIATHETSSAWSIPQRYGGLERKACGGAESYGRRAREAGEA